MGPVDPAIARGHRWLWIGVLALLLALFLTSFVSAQEGPGYWYTVRRGDTWASISARTGVSVAELMRANPQAIHPRLWLYRGERIWIPRAGGETGYWYTVRRGDSWTSIARRTGVSVRTLMQANPQAIHARRWLYRGERIWIPTGQAPTTPTPTPAPSPTPTPQPPIVACPETLQGYPMAIVAHLIATGGDVDALADWLSGCGAITETQGEVRKVDLTGDGQEELVVVLTSPTSDLRVPPGDLLVFRPPDWSLIFQANAGGAVELLEAGDLNEDGQMDLVWQETSCGIHTCFGTIYIVSWTGTEFQNWMDGTLAMASIEVQLDDVNQGSGREIIAHGGVINSLSAGPQRAWTETWASPDGGPYVRVSKVYDPSNCLYHTILDANQAFLQGRSDNFAQAVTLYRKALEDPSLIACWVRPNELEELRTFAAFRLAMAYAYQGDLTNAEAMVKDLQDAYPDAVYAQIADIWWTAYQPTQDMSAACAAVNAFVTGPPARPEAYEMLADYGYANPTFTAEDVCPVLP